MVDSQKSQIDKMRLSGYGYFKIAKAIGVSENTVKSYCRRQKSTDYKEEVGCCAECGFIRETEMLKRYIEEMEAGDSTNREGHAAKVYFNALFGLDFTRRSECTTNAALDYGYGLILSAFNREAAANGYLSQLGLHHDNAFNPYNLSSDLMEPYRILIDRTVRECGFTEFSTAEKHRLVAVLYSTVTIGAAKQNVMNAIRLYVKSVFDALNDDTVSDIRWYRL